VIEVWSVGSATGRRLALEATAREIRQVSLVEALELTLLIARKEPHRHLRVAARWLLRYLEESDEATIDEATMVAACLAALAGDRYRDAALTLRAVPRGDKSTQFLVGVLWFRGIHHPSSPRAHG